LELPGKSYADTPSRVCGHDCPGHPIISGLGLISKNALSDLDQFLLVLEAGVTGKKLAMQARGAPKEGTIETTGTSHTPIFLAAIPVRGA
jgi:hypothetical protein